MNNLEIAKQYVKQFVLPDGSDEEIEDYALDLEDKGITSDILKYYIYNDKQIPVNVVNDPLQCFSMIVSDVPLEYQPSDPDIGTFTGYGFRHVNHIINEFSNDLSDLDLQKTGIESVDNGYANFLKTISENTNNLPNGKGKFRELAQEEADCEIVDLRKNPMVYRNSDGEYIKADGKNKLDIDVIRQLNENGIIPIFVRVCPTSSVFTMQYPVEPFPHIITKYDIERYINVPTQAKNKDLEIPRNCKIALKDYLVTFSSLLNVKSTLADSIRNDQRLPGKFKFTGEDGALYEWPLYEMDDNFWEKIYLADVFPFTVQMMGEMRYQYVFHSQEEIKAFCLAYAEAVNEKDIDADRFENATSILEVAHLLKELVNKYDRLHLFYEALVGSSNDLDIFLCDMIGAKNTNKPYWQSKIIPPMFLFKKGERIADPTYEGIASVTHRDVIGTKALDMNLEERLVDTELTEHYIKWRKIASSVGINKDNFRQMCEEEYNVLIKVGHIDSSVSFDTIYPSYMFE